MNPEQKARLEALRAKSASELTEVEKTELNLLGIIEKQDQRIIEKDTLIGTRATELDNLKKELDGKTGKDKENLEARIAEKQESVDTLKEALQALKEARETNTDLVGKISHKNPGHGDAVDPKELQELERRAFEDEEAKAAIEELYKNMDDDDKKAYRSDPAFKKGIFERVLSDLGDNTDDSPWGSAVKKEEGTPHETVKERIDELFDGRKNNHRKLPPNSSGRGGRGRTNSTAMPRPTERPVDERAG